MKRFVEFYLGAARAVGLTSLSQRMLARMRMEILRTRPPFPPLLEIEVSVAKNADVSTSPLGGRCLRKT